MRIASLDLGSNTFLLLIADVNEKGELKVIEDHVEITRLAQLVDQTGEFHKDALERAENCFKKFKTIIDENNVDKVVASATSAARDAKNKDVFFALGDKYQIPITIIEGQKEAELTFKGSTFDETERAVAVIDVGGGSTEVIGNVNNNIVGKSIDVGSVRLTERFVTAHPISEKELNDLSLYVKQQLQENTKLLPKENVKKVIAVAGTPTMLACLMQEIDFDENKVHRFNISLDQLKQWQIKLAQLNIEQRQQIKGMQAKRADVIVAGLTILYETLAFLGADQLMVSTKGVRYGLAIETAASC